MFCRKCGKEIPDDSVFCPKCGMNCEIKLNIEQDKKVELNKTPKKETVIKREENIYKAQPPQPPNTAVRPANNQPQPANNQQMNDNTQNVYLNIILFTRIAAIISLILSIILGTIAENLLPDTPNNYYFISQAELDKYNSAINSYNSVIIFSNIFCVIFFICDFIRLVCAIILAAAKGQFAGVGIFMGVGLAITLLIGALIHNMAAVFIIFGLIAFAYLGHKISDWY